MDVGGRVLHPVQGEHFLDRLVAAEIGHVCNGVHALLRLPRLVPIIRPRVSGRLVNVRVPGPDFPPPRALVRATPLLVAPRQQPSAVRLAALVQLVVAPPHVDEELWTVGGGVRQPLPPLGAGEVRYEREDGRGGGQAAGRRQGEVEGAEPAPERGLGQRDQGFARGLLVRADDVVGVELQSGLVPPLLGLDHVPQPVHGAVAHEGVAAHAEGGEAVDGELGRLQGRQAATAQRDPFQVSRAVQHPGGQLLEAPVTVQRDPLQVHVVGEGARVHADDGAVVQLEAPQLVQVAETGRVQHGQRVAAEYQVGEHVEPGKGGRGHGSEVVPGQIEAKEVGQSVESVVADVPDDVVGQIQRDQGGQRG